MKKLSVLLAPLFLLLPVAAPSFASTVPGTAGQFTVSNFNFDRSSGSMTFNYSGQELATCNTLALSPYDALQGNYSNGSLFYASDGPDGHGITCDSSSVTAGLGADPNATNFTNASSLVITVRTSSPSEWYESQIIPNPYYVPNMQVSSFDTTVNGDVYSTTGYFTDNDPSAASWTGTIDYGDGSGTQSLSVDRASFHPNHQYTNVGTYTVTVHIANNIGASAAGTSTVKVVNPIQVSSLSGGTIGVGGTYYEDGAFTDPNSNATSWTATVKYGDGDDRRSSALPLTGQLFQLNHTYNTTGTYHVTVTITDNLGATGTTTGTVTVTNNTAPTVNSITVTPDPVQVSAPVSVSGTFSDPDTGDVHTATWDWGDGSTPTSGTVTEPSGRNPGTVGPDSHTYTSAGVYPVALTVTDSQGATGTQTYQYMSVYNPTSQGLFSAGQRYSSPAGSYTQNTSLIGNIKFGLSYKYKGTVPTGTRQFSMDFNAANLHFNATTVSSLVISNGVGTLTGTGTLNGSGTYNYLVTGSESANTVRIQITDPNNNNAAIYDTQPGAAATATPTTTVTGNVIAH